MNFGLNLTVGTVPERSNLRKELVGLRISEGFGPSGPRGRAARLRVDGEVIDTL